MVTFVWLLSVKLNLDSRHCIWNWIELIIVDLSGGKLRNDDKSHRFSSQLMLSTFINSRGHHTSDSNIALPIQKI